MSVTIRHDALTGRTKTAGTVPARPARWSIELSATVAGEKHRRTITAGPATLDDLIPVIRAQITDLFDETGDTVTQAGWVAHGRGVKK